MQFTESQRCQEMLEAMQNSDPWSPEAILRARARVQDVFAKVVDINMQPDDVCSMEDAINYVGAEVLALIILLNDVMDDDSGFLVALAEQVGALREMLTQ